MSLDAIRLSGNKLVQLRHFKDEIRQKRRKSRLLHPLIFSLAGFSTPKGENAKTRIRSGFCDVIRGFQELVKESVKPIGLCTVMRMH